jgi:hypothetical protein
MSSADASECVYEIVGESVKSYIVAGNRNMGVAIARVILPCR